MSLHNRCSKSAVLVTRTRHLTAREVVARDTVCGCTVGEQGLGEENCDSWADPWKQDQFGRSPSRTEEAENEKTAKMITLLCEERELEDDEFCY